MTQILQDINKDPDFIAKMESNGFSMLDVGPKEMPDFMAEIKDRYGKLAEQMGITKE